jgi:hypothetical protein
MSAGFLHREIPIGPLEDTSLGCLDRAQTSLPSVIDRALAWSLGRPGRCGTVRAYHNGMALMPTEAMRGRALSARRSGPQIRPARPAPGLARVGQ